MLNQRCGSCKIPGFISLIFNMKVVFIVFLLASAVIAKEVDLRNLAEHLGLEQNSEKAQEVEKLISNLVNLLQDSKSKVANSAQAVQNNLNKISSDNIGVSLNTLSHENIAEKTSNPSSDLTSNGAVDSASNLLKTVSDNEYVKDIVNGLPSGIPENGGIQNAAANSYNKYYQMISDKLPSGIPQFEDFKNAAANKYDEYYQGIKDKLPSEISQILNKGESVMDENNEEHLSSNENNYQVNFKYNGFLKPITDFSKKVAQGGVRLVNNIAKKKVEGLTALDHMLEVEN